MTPNIVQVVDAESFSKVISVSRETIDNLLLYEGMLRKWQKSINLVATGTLDDIWSRHFWDSAQLIDLTAQDSNVWLDVGSGAGFPGLVVALLLKERPGFSMHLVESDQRKAVFLREVIRTLRLPATVYSERIETLKLQLRPDIISARALASLGKLFNLTAPFWGKHTVGLFLKGAGVGEELTQASKDWIFEHEAIVSQSDFSGKVLKIWGLQHAGA